MILHKSSYCSQNTNSGQNKLRTLASCLIEFKRRNEPSITLVPGHNAFHNTPW